MRRDLHADGYHFGYHSATENREKEASRKPSKRTVEYRSVLAIADIWSVAATGIDDRKIHGLFEVMR